MADDASKSPKADKPAPKTAPKAPAPAAKPAAAAASAPNTVDHEHKTHSFRRRLLRLNR